MSESSSDDRKVVKEARIPIVDEEVRVEKRDIVGGEVRVTTRPVTERVKIEESLCREDVEVRRVPRDEVVETPPQVVETHDRIVVPVVEERLVVEKRLVLVEEIHLVRKSTQEQVEREEDVRRTEVSIKRD